METTNKTSLRYLADKGYKDALKHKTSYLHITEKEIILTNEDDDINNPREQYDIKSISGYKKGKGYNLSIFVDGKEIVYRVYKKDEIIAALELRRRDLFSQESEELPRLTDGDISINKKTYDYNMINTQELDQNSRGHFVGKISKAQKKLEKITWIVIAICLVLFAGIFLYQYFSVEKTAKAYAVDNSEYWVATYSDYFDLESYFYQKGCEIDSDESAYGFSYYDERSGESLGDGREITPTDYAFFAKVAAFCARSNNGILYKGQISEAIEKEIDELNANGDEVLFGAHYSYLAPADMIIDWFNHPVLFSLNVEKLGYDFEDDMKNEITVLEIKKNKELSKDFGEGIRKVYDVVYIIGGMRGYMKCRIGVSSGEYGLDRDIRIISQSENYENLQ